MAIVGPKGEDIAVIKVGNKVVIGMTQETALSANKTHGKLTLVSSELIEHHTGRIRSEQKVIALPSGTKAIKITNDVSGGHDVGVENPRTSIRIVPTVISAEKLGVEIYWSINVMTSTGKVTRDGILARFYDMSGSPLIHGKIIHEEFLISDVLRFDTPSRAPTWAAYSVQISKYKFTIEW